MMRVASKPSIRLAVSCLCLGLSFGLASLDDARAQAAAPTSPNEYVSKAKQAILMDAESGATMYQLKADELVPPASMSKLMTLAVVFKAIKLLLDKSKGGPGHKPRF